MTHPTGVRTTGPWPLQDAIWTDPVEALDYSPLSAKNLLRVTAHLSRWMDAAGLCPQDLTEIGSRPLSAIASTVGTRVWRTLRGIEPISSRFGTRGWSLPPSSTGREHSPGPAPARVRDLSPGTSWPWPPPPCCTPCEPLTGSSAMWGRVTWRR